MLILLLLRYRHHSVSFSIDPVYNCKYIKQLYCNCIQPENNTENFIKAYQCTSRNYAIRHYLFDEKKDNPNTKENIFLGFVVLASVTYIT